MIEIAAYQPDIAQNLGTLIRTGACLNMPVHVIEPCGFPFSIKALRRSAMDYMQQANITQHLDYVAFREHMVLSTPAKRMVLLTTKGSVPYTDHQFAPGDILLLGQESAGVPDNIHADADVRLRIPMAPGTRSLNIAISLAMVAGEALRQLNSFPKEAP